MKDSEVDMRERVIKILQEYHGCHSLCEGCNDKTDRILALIKSELEQELAYHNQWAKDIAKELGCADAAQYRNDAIEVIRKWRTCVVEGGASCVY